MPILLRFVLAVCVLAAATVFVVRGPVNGLSSGGDFILIYTPARAWLFGENPYDVPALDRVWLAAGGEPELQPSTRPDGAPLYPISTMVLLAPFAALPWVIAKPVWIVANVAFIAIALWSIGRVGGWHAKQARFWVFIGLALMFMPVHTAIRHGQTPLLVLALLGLGLAASVNAPARWRAGGVMMSMAALLKPQIGVPFLALDVLRRRWMSVITALAMMVIVTIFAIIPMWLRHIPWWSSWRANLSAFTEGNAGDPSRSNPIRHQLLNLHYPLHELVANRAIVNAVVLAIVAGLAAVFFRSLIVRCVRSFSPTQRAFPSTGGDDRDSLLRSLSMVAVLTLMIVYHRYYDAVLLLLPLAWAIHSISQRRRLGVAWGMIALMSPFFINSAALLFRIEQRAALPSAFIDSWFWNGLLMPLQAWALLCMAVLLQFAPPHVQDEAR